MTSYTLEVLNVIDNVGNHFFRWFLMEIVLSGVILKLCLKKIVHCQQTVVCVPI